MIMVPRALFREIQAHGERAFPNECCGVLLGRDGEGMRRVLAVLPIENAFEDGERYHRFLITPEEYRRAEKTAAEKKMDLLGFYHSHPDSPSVASQYDLEHAFPWFSYIIVSIMNREYHDVHAWLMAEDRSSFHEEDIVVE